MKTTLYLVRHGQSEARARNIVQGVGLDIPLTPEGVIQAARAAGVLAGYKFDKIFSSTAVRARDTAAIIRRRHPGVPYEEIAELNERSKGVTEGMTKDDFAAKYPEIIEQWNKEEDARPPGGENFEDVANRVVPTIERHVAGDAKGSSFLYVIHGNVIRAILGHILDVPHRLRPRIEQDYCAFNVARYDHERARWSVECVNRV
ncbi:hypothetical protein A3F28_02100 [Candidatus Uhrbacteria bacterium RIFCSPHIGHO2_12_FULL_57_11]|uniref:phosphoglycerate mutase (2,3-diphosphoglycerate-dependent) n=2 Tax=Candidatus Uhriibacteriota TaxID=1752732 RepID=A0A1F7UK88_9BACT|nr:MAG: hypothetical protein A3D72_01005 [Candidatus Uhrbacteria bacterium RIFCSPHIGHO2_02_FULL_57_19]OGL78696.1 MAG: hypothetical protein A3F28_02100 [Candidatus Uhrbacteria bacterium RIFCSPHIGHO2_12_FULL_57_11]